jgi:hypothetical protein
LVIFFLSLFLFFFNDQYEFNQVNLKKIKGKVTKGWWLCHLLRWSVNPFEDRPHLDKKKKKKKRSILALQGGLATPKGQTLQKQFGGLGTWEGLALGAKGKPHKGKAS